ncbi:MAG: helix-turn-helix domain-containing protein [Micrococcus sp.]|nr:helix-turn-helix domain-containing protein [Micrococcus sp.]
MLRDAEGAEIQLPEGIQRMLMATLTSVAKNGEASIGRVPDELTSTVAADMLGVSRPILMKWVHEGRIDSFKVGSHARFKRADVMRLRDKRMAERRAAFEDFRAIRDRVEKLTHVMDEVIGDLTGDLPFSGTDAHDYPVHAAAVAGRADRVLTEYRATNFTTTPNEEYYEVIKPDDFFMLVTDSNPDCLLPITKIQFDYWSSRARGAQLDEALRQAQCPQFAGRVLDALRRLA